ncbi:hypothetical protein KBA63_03515 [Candidatus Woesebacteria bacterium]|jgi:hypothetical protein|nr:hypothetical protein [Candidatus Woesebacteria bacterium]MBP9687759.1 hypothetical protein [Candidatus Woesebacteria bacterium]
MSNPLTQIDFVKIKRLSEPSTQFSSALGQMIQDTLTLSNMTRAQAIKLLVDDPELIEAFEGSLTLGLLVCCTMGQMNIELIELVLRKVCDITGAVMEFA